MLNHNVNNESATKVDLHGFRIIRNNGTGARTVATCTLLILLLWIVKGVAQAGPDPGQRHAEIAGMRLSMLKAAAGYAGGSGMIVRGEKTVYAWGDLSKRHDVKPSAASIGMQATVKEMVHIGRLHLRRGRGPGVCRVRG